MSVWGAVIMSFFGGVFAALTLHWQWQVDGVALSLPFLVFAIVGSLAAYIIRLPGERHILTKAVERTIIWSSVAEGIGLFIVSTIIANVRHPELQLPAMALIVGLHFLPIAFAASYRPFYGLAAILILSAIGGVAIDAPLGGDIAGVTAAVALWIAAFLGLARDWRSKTNSVLSVSAAV